MSAKFKISCVFVSTLDLSEKVTAATDTKKNVPKFSHIIQKLYVSPTHDVTQLFLALFDVLQKKYED